jgi:phage terminase Nu1 subunit (DNA packaging protein)
VTFATPLLGSVENFLAGGRGEPQKIASHCEGESAFSFSRVSIYDGGEMPTVVLTNPNMLCSATVLAEILGLSSQRVRQLVKAGALRRARTRLNGMHFRLGENVQRFVQYQVDLASEEAEANNDAFAKARTRKAEAGAQMMELQLAAMRGEFLPKDEVGFWLGLMLVNTRDRLRAVPAKIMHSLPGRNAVECNRITAEAIDGALLELSERKFFFNVESSRKKQVAYLESRGVPRDEAERLVNRNGEEPPAAD